MDTWTLGSFNSQLPNVPLIVEYIGRLSNMMSSHYPTAGVWRPLSVADHFIPRN